MSLLVCVFSASRHRVESCLLVCVFSASRHRVESCLLVSHFRSCVEFSNPHVEIYYLDFLLSSPTLLLSLLYHHLALSSVLSLALLIYLLSYPRLSPLNNRHLALSSLSPALLPSLLSHPLFYPMFSLSHSLTLSLYIYIYISAILSPSLSLSLSLSLVSSLSQLDYLLYLSETRKQLEFLHLKYDHEVVLHGYTNIFTSLLVGLPCYR